MGQAGRRVVGLALLCSVMVVVPGSGAAFATKISAAKRVPLVDSNCMSVGLVRPTSIVLACGDGNAAAEHLVWKRWTTRGATATGTLAENDCEPDCVDGTFHSYPATFRLSETVTADKRLYYTRVTVSFPDAAPAQRKVEVVKDCFDTPPAAYIPRCPADLQAAG